MKSQTAEERHKQLLSFVTFGLLAFLFAIAVFSKVLQYFNFDIHDWDTGIYSNVAWNISQGRGFFSEIRQFNQLGEHFSPITAIFAPLMLISPTPIWFMVVQGAAIGIFYILLYRIALKVLTDAETPLASWLALIFPVLAFFFRPLTAALLYEFHPSTLAPPILAAAVLAMLYRRDLLMWGSVLLLLTTKENAPLGILALSLYSGFVQRRWTLAVFLCLTAAISAYVIMGLIMPSFQHDNWGHYNRLGLLEHLEDKSQYLIRLMKGVCFLPLLAWRSLLAAIPPVAINLVVKYEPQFSLDFHYDDMSSVMLLVAAIHGFTVLVGLSKRLWPDRSAALAGLGVATILMALDWIEFRTPMPLERAQWPGIEERQLREELARYQKLPGSIGIAAMQPLGPYLSARPRYAAIQRRHLNKLSRLLPGDLLFLTPIRDSRKYVELQPKMISNENLTLVHRSAVLEVYEIRRPLAF